MNLITFKNLKKGLTHLRSGNYAVIASAVQNLWAQKNDIADEKQESTEVEEFTCEQLQPSQPIVSIIIPCFNYGTFVESAIDSVLRQTLKNIEIIIVDGGSTDQVTVEILRKLNRPRTKVFFHNDRRLVGANRNFGIQQSAGRYICCLDADDTLEATYLEKAVFFLETYGYSISSTAIRFVGAKTGTVGILPTPDLQKMVQGNHILTCAVFRRSLWNQCGGYFDTGLGHDHVAEDWDFWIRLAASGARIRNIAGEALFNYRVHNGGSLSSSSEVRSITAQRDAIIKRNKDLLTPEAYRLSLEQKTRHLRARSVSTALTSSMSSVDPVERPLTLMLTIPYMLIGGAERLLSQLCAHLVKKEWRVLIVTTLSQDDSDGDATDWFKKYTVEVYALPRFLQPVEWHDFIEHLIISRQPDCLMNAGSQFFYELLPSLTQRYPTMATVDLLFNTVGHVESHCRYKDFYTFALAESEQVFHWFLNSGWEESRVRKIASGVDLVTYQRKLKPPELLSLYGILPTDFVVGFSGRLSPEKAPEVFVEIARLSQGVPNLRFIMTGGGSMRDEIKKLVSELPSTIRFDFVGIVDDVTPYLSLYDILVLPSHLDGRPLVVLESLACGTPVLASRVGGLPEVIIDDTNGYLCTPAVASEFAAHISTLAADKPKVEKLKVGARVFAEKHLDAEASFSEYERALLDAISYQRSHVEKQGLL